MHVVFGIHQSSQTVQTVNPDKYRPNLSTGDLIQTTFVLISKQQKVSKTDFSMSVEYSGVL